MSKFNTKKPSTATTNYEGGKAYKLTTKDELITAVLTTFLENTYYEKSNDRVTRIQTLCKQVEPQFLAKLAVYARTVFNLRSVFPVLVGELSKVDKGTGLTRRAIATGVTRVDDVTEIVAYLGKKNLTSSVKRGISDALNKFDSYQFAKYRGEGNAVSLVDVVNLCHPKATNEKTKEALKGLIEGTLKNTETWESKLSAGEDKGKVFRDLINENKLGYMALLRNLRNILETDPDKELTGKICQILSDPEKVRKSKQLPMRFLSAYRNLDTKNPFVTKEIQTALEKGVKASAQNIEGFDENTRVFVASDISGSMQSPLSKNSSLQYYDVGLLLGQVLGYRCKNVVQSAFGTNFSLISFADNTILANVEFNKGLGSKLGNGTEGWKVINYLNSNKIETDKVMIFTDCQMYNSTSYLSNRTTAASEWSKYRQKFPNAKLYIFDLTGYGTTPVANAGNGVTLVAGFSEKIFEVLKHNEQGTGGLISEIEKIEF